MLLQDDEVRNIGVRIMNELVEPFREIDIDDEEFACLKAIIFFDPNVHGLTKIREVRHARKQVQVYHKVHNIFQGSHPGTEV